MSKTAIKNLIRQTYNNIASGTGDNSPIAKYKMAGVPIIVAQVDFLAEPSLQKAVDIVVYQLKAELSKIIDKEIPRHKWPKFFQDDAWEEKTYHSYGVPCPGKVHETAEDTPQSTVIEQRMDATGWSAVKDVIPRVVNDIGKREI